MTFKTGDRVWVIDTDDENYHCIGDIVEDGSNLGLPHDREYCVAIELAESGEHWTEPTWYRAGQIEIAPGDKPMTNFKTGDRVRVTPEYAAWYREKHGTDPAFTPETELIVDALLAKGRLNVREDRRWYHAFDIPSRFLVRAEPDHTAAVIEAARGVLANFRVGAYEESGVTYTKVEIRMNGRWYVWEGRFDDAVAWAEDGLFATLQAQANAIDAYDESETP